MSHIHDAIRALNPSIITIRDEEAFDEQGNSVSYDLQAAQAKLVELQAEEDAAKQAAEVTKQSAIQKLSKLGLTAEEISALGVK